MLPSSLPTQDASVSQVVHSSEASTKVEESSLLPSANNLRRTTNQLLSTNILNGGSTKVYQTHTQFLDHQFSTKHFAEEKSSMARAPPLDLQGGGEDVAPSSWLSESNILDGTVSPQPINRFSKLDVTKKTGTAATVTMKVILSTAFTTRKLLTPKSLELPDYKVTAGEQKMLGPSTVLVVDQATGLGQLDCIVYFKHIKQYF